ncbi:hypothetical protein RFF05_08440 [Bengtsoniella intestinalis]|uniref:hypothetical protein n=1 Tax=Bengtsoniella intestinalis TaxID=3073143 RepID=UPI00391F230E
MDDNKPSRSGAEIAAKLAQLAVSLARIIKAAMAAGLHGAAVAAAKEALPFLVKVVAWALFIAILIPMLIISAIPNIFFGFLSDVSSPVVDMAEKAIEIGSAYMGIDVWIVEQIDDVVTSLVGDYEDNGMVIDLIEIENMMDDDDLCWLIAINSVAFQQDLTQMTALDVMAFVGSFITHTPTILQIAVGETIETVLHIEIDSVDGEDLMDAYNFDDDAKDWARTLYYVMSESDSLTGYDAYLSLNAPNYSGDSSYTGTVLPGGTVNTEIDISGFTDPSTKNSDDLAAYAIQAWENGWGYVWGTFGNVLTEALLTYKITQYPDGVGNYEAYIRANWLGGRTTDCVGLIKGYGWLNTDTLTISYGTNGMPDYSANQMYLSATVSGDISTMPDTPGIAVWKDGHIGVYIGDGYVIEAMGTSYGVVKTELADRGWTNWCEIPYITYS